MAKRKRCPSEEKMLRWIKEGRGQGRGSEYKPWLRIQDVPSQGLSSRVLGRKTGRTHHLLSKLETAFFYLWEWHPHIIDIREQYPLLPLSATQAIADRLRIRHPAFRGIPVVMTTDVVVTIERNDRLIEVAITIKYAKDLGNKRTLEKLEIERVFWRDLSIPWLIVVDRDLPTALARNLEHLHPFHDPLAFFPLTATDIATIGGSLTDAVRSSRAPLCKIAGECDAKFHLRPGTSLAISYHLIATRHWCIDLLRPFQPELPIQILKHGPEWDAMVDQVASINRQFSEEA